MYEPTQEEIRQGMLEIQRSWTTLERERRRVATVYHQWDVPNLPAYWTWWDINERDVSE